MGAPPRARPAAFWRYLERALQSLHGLSRADARAAVTNRKEWLAERSARLADINQGGEHERDA